MTHDPDIVTALIDDAESPLENRANDTVGWSHFASRVCEQGLAGTILNRFHRAAFKVPCDVTSVLERHANAIASENRNTLAELSRIGVILNRSGVTAMLLKGTALLATGVYDSPSQREMTDADLLIRPKQISAALTALEAVGCRRGADLLRADFFPRFHYETELFTTGLRPIRIDLHARSFHPLRFARVMPDDAFFEDAQKVRIGDATYLVPSNETMLIHLAAHAAFHGFEKLRWVYDLKRFADWTECESIAHSSCERKPIDASKKQPHDVPLLLNIAKRERATAAGNRGTIKWHTFTERCATWRLSLPVHAGLTEANHVFGNVFPKDLLSELANHKANWRDRLTLRNAHNLGESPLKHIGTNLLTTPGVRYKLSYLAAVLLPDKHHLAQIYPYKHIGWKAAAHVWRFIRRTIHALIRL